MLSINQEHLELIMSLFAEEDKSNLPIRKDEIIDQLASSS
jgi:hypothetical protein